MNKARRQLRGSIAKNKLSAKQQGAPQINNTAKNMQNPVSYNNHFGITAPPGYGAVFPGIMAQNMSWKPKGYPGMTGPMPNTPPFIATGPVKGPTGTVTPGNPTTIGGTPTVVRNPITSLYPPLDPAPTYVSPNMSGTVTASGGVTGVTLADFTPIFDITQNDELSSFLQIKPISILQIDAVTVCEKVSNKAGTGQTEWKTFKFTSNNTFDYTVKILFDMYSAKDKMTVYQSSSTQTGSGRVIASTQNNNLSQLTSSEKNELGQAFGIASGSHYGGLQSFQGPDSSGFLTFAGKLTFPYNADNGRYIHVKIEKNPNTSIAFRYYICFPQDVGQTQPITKPPATKKKAPVASNALNLGNIPIGIPNFGNFMIGPGGGGGSGYNSATFSMSGIGGGIIGGGWSIPNFKINIPKIPNLGKVSQATTSTFTAGSQRGKSYTPKVTQPGTVPSGSGGQTVTGTKFIHWPPLAKKNGKYQQKFYPVQIPVCLPKPRVKICGEPLGVGKGDSFKIDDCTINMDLGANATLTNVKNAIESQCNTVIVNISASPNTKEKCLSIIKKSSDPNGY